MHQHSSELSGSLSTWICMRVCARTQEGLRKWGQFNNDPVGCFFSLFEDLDVVFIVLIVALEHNVGTVVLQQLDKGCDTHASILLKNSNISRSPFWCCQRPLLREIISDFGQWELIRKVILCFLTKRNESILRKWTQRHLLFLPVIFEVYFTYY
jgi:hypothetical protein